MQKRLALLPAIAFTVAACSSDQPTSPRSPSELRRETSFTSATAPSGAHYRNGFSEPTCSISGGGVSCTGSQIAGVGNTNATLLLTASYTATVRCRNNGGKIVDVKTQTTTSSSATLTPDARNGTLVVSPIASSAPSEQSFLDAATCPNPNWTKLLVPGSPSLSGYTYTLTFDGFSQPAISLTG